ncbi:hypothetical protein HQ520_13285 [bacterium]|nr:hypothetical protein [bacterium]
MLNAEMVKKQARALGADVVGIGNIERWKGAPLQMDPLQIMPEAKSVIGLVFRVMRGSLRGIEEGTFFSNYPAMGYGGITYMFMPMVVRGVCQMIEDEGYEAFPMGGQSDWRGIDNVGDLKPGFSRPVEPGKATPDVMLHLRIGAYLCGLGEIGYSKMLLTPQFGPRNRVGLILTEAEIEPDPIYEGPPLCNRCMACVTQCPGHAISGEKTVKVNLAGHEVEWGEIDNTRCIVAFRGGEEADDTWPEEQEYGAYGSKRTRPAEWSPFHKKPKNLYNTGEAVCGGRGCMRACMISLENRGVLQNKFHQKFRRRKPWSVDWAAEHTGERTEEGAGRTE